VFGLESQLVEKKLEASSPSARFEFFKGEKPVREVVYTLEEFLSLSKGRRHYEIVREPYDAGGLAGIKVHFIVTSRSKEGHVLKYEEIRVLDPFNIEGDGNAYDRLRSMYDKIVMEYNKRAQELGATPGRWC